MYENVSKFEEELAEFTSSKYAIATDMLYPCHRNLFKNTETSVHKIYSIHIFKCAYDF